MSSVFEFARSSSRLSMCVWEYGLDVRKRIREGSGEVVVFSMDDFESVPLRHDLIPTTAQHSSWTMRKAWSYTDPATTHPSPSEIFREDFDVPHKNTTHE